MEKSMNKRFIQSISIDWDQINFDSYLQHIEALKNMKLLDFWGNVTFFAGENGTGKFRS